MTTLTNVKNLLDQTFNVKSFGLDLQMEMFLPRAYEPAGFDWRHYFDEDFVGNLNGLMIRGDETVNKVFLGSFPHPAVLQRFVDRSNPGDLFFTHHPIYMLCGDPRGSFGAGWMPLPKEMLDTIKAKHLSFYSCHGPMDYNRALGTRSAMLQTLDATFEEDFFFDGKGHHGAIASINPVSAQELAELLKTTYDLPYVDLAGHTEKKTIRRIAIIAGGADSLGCMEEAERKGVDAYIAGEIFTRLNTAWGKENNPRMLNFCQHTSMTMIGLSHAGSEYLTMKVQIADWLKKQLGVETELLPQDRWWE